MQRLLSTALVLGLLVATASAFAVTEGLKLTKSPVSRTRVDKVLSPAGDVPGARIQFWLRKRDELTLTVVDSRRREVDRLVDGVTAHRKWNSFIWDGRTSSGSVAPDGVYYPRVHLAKAHRTILLPNAIQIDTRVPEVLEASTNRVFFSPDGDGQSDSVRIRYKLSERAHALLFVRGKRVVNTRSSQRANILSWYGRVGGAPLPQGTYRLRVGAVDPAGNVTGEKDGKVVVVHVRYIQLARALLMVKAGTRFGIGVDTDAESYSWRFNNALGFANQDVLILRAPREPGRYRLVVEERGHRSAATVVVVPRQ